MLIMFKRPDGTYLNARFNSENSNNKDKHYSDAVYMFVKYWRRLYVWTFNEGIFEITKLESIFNNTKNNVNSFGYILTVNDVDIDKIWNVYNHCREISIDEVIDTMIEKLGNNAENKNITSNVEKIKEYGKHMEKDKFIEWLIKKMAILMENEAKTI